MGTTQFQLLTFVVLLAILETTVARGLWTKQGCAIAVQSSTGEERLLWGLLEHTTPDYTYGYYGCNTPCGCYNGYVYGTGGSQVEPWAAAAAEQGQTTGIKGVIKGGYVNGISSATSANQYDSTQSGSSSSSSNSNSVLGIVNANLGTNNGNGGYGPGRLPAAVSNYGVGGNLGSTNYHGVNSVISSSSSLASEQQSSSSSNSASSGQTSVGTGGYAVGTPGYGVSAGGVYLAGMRPDYSGGQTGYPAQYGVESLIQGSHLEQSSSSAAQQQQSASSANQANLVYGTQYLTGQPEYGMNIGVLPQPRPTVGTGTVDSGFPVAYTDEGTFAVTQPAPQQFQPIGIVYTGGNNIPYNGQPGFYGGGLVTRPNRPSALGFTGTGASVNTFQGDGNFGSGGYLAGESAGGAYVGGFRPSGLAVGVANTYVDNNSAQTSSSESSSNFGASGQYLTGNSGVRVSGGGAYVGGIRPSGSVIGGSNVYQDNTSAQSSLSNSQQSSSSNFGASAQYLTGTSGAGVSTGEAYVSGIRPTGSVVGVANAYVDNNSAQGSLSNSQQSSSSNFGTSAQYLTGNSGVGVSGGGAYVGVIRPSGSAIGASNVYLDNTSAQSSLSNSQQSSSSNFGASTQYLTGNSGSGVSTGEAYIGGIRPTGSVVGVANAYMDNNSAQSSSLASQQASSSNFAATEQNLSGNYGVGVSGIGAYVGGIRPSGSVIGSSNVYQDNTSAQSSLSNSQQSSNSNSIATAQYLTGNSGVGVLAGGAYVNGIRPSGLVVGVGNTYVDNNLAQSSSLATQQAASSTFGSSEQYSTGNTGAVEAYVSGIRPTGSVVGVANTYVDNNSAQSSSLASQQASSSNFAATEHYLSGNTGVGVSGGAYVSGIRPGGSAVGVANAYEANSAQSSSLASQQASSSNFGTSEQYLTENSGVGVSAGGSYVGGIQPSSLVVGVSNAYVDNISGQSGLSTSQQSSSSSSGSSEQYLGDNSGTGGYLTEVSGGGAYVGGIRPTSSVAGVSNTYGENNAQSSSTAQQSSISNSGASEQYLTGNTGVRVSDGIRPSISVVGASNVYQDTTSAQSSLSNSQQSSSSNFGASGQYLTGNPGVGVSAGGAYVNGIRPSGLAVGVASTYVDNNSAQSSSSATQQASSSTFGSSAQYLTGNSGAGVSTGEAYVGGIRPTGSVVGVANAYVDNNSAQVSSEVTNQMTGSTFGGSGQYLSGNSGVGVSAGGSYVGGIRPSGLVVGASNAYEDNTSAQSSLSTSQQSSSSSSGSSEQYLGDNSGTGGYLTEVSGGGAYVGGIRPTSSVAGVSNTYGENNAQSSSSAQQSSISNSGASEHYLTGASEYLAGQSDSALSASSSTSVHEASASSAQVELGSAYSSGASVAVGGTPDVGFGSNYYTGSAGLSQQQSTASKTTSSSSSSSSYQGSSSVGVEAGSYGSEGLIVGAASAPISYAIAPPPSAATPDCRKCFESVGKTNIEE